MQLDAADALGHDVERLVPRDRGEAASGADERTGQAIGVVVLQVALDALRAELPLVEGEFLPRLDADHALVFHREGDAALLAAEAAVRVDGAVGRRAGGEAAGRLVIQVRPVRLDQGLGAAGKRRHHAARSRDGLAGRAPAVRGWKCAPRSADCAVATSRRRQAGQ